MVTRFDAIQHVPNCRSSHPEVFLTKGVLKICSKFTGEHPYRSAISIKLQSNFIGRELSGYIFGRELSG